MSLPQRPLLPNSSASMDDKPPRLGYPFAMCGNGGGVGGGGVGGSGSGATSSPSSVFPVFPANFQQVYNNLMQAHLMQLAHQQQQQQQQHQQHQQQLHNQRSHNHSDDGLPKYVNGAGVSPANSDQASSRSVSPPSSTKKLVLDEDGCATCPACGDKVAEPDWAPHLEVEKQKLISHITSVREGRCRSRLSTSYDPIVKRENELQRIRNNQQKRQILKRTTTSTIIRDCLTPFSRQSNDETGSSESPDTKKENEEFSIKCSSCSQPCAYAIIMSSFDRPKCQMCFDIIRTQSCVLTSSSPLPENHRNVENDVEERDEEAEDDLSPICKKIKLETPTLVVE